MNGEMIHVEVDGHRMPSYLVRPERRDAPGVVLLQEIFGVNAEMRRVADLVAAHGYAAIAPNFYHRTHPDLDAAHDEEGIRTGMAAAMSTTAETLSADVQAAAQRLLDDGARKVGSWGFCFGGSVAYLSATLPQISAAVSFYGGQIARSRVPGQEGLIRFTELIQAPLFLAFGARDEGIPPEDIETIRSSLTEHGKKFELHVYPDVGHAFFRRAPDGSETEAAREVWPKVDRFLGDNLRR